MNMGLIGGSSNDREQTHEYKTKSSAARNVSRKLDKQAENGWRLVSMHKKDDRSGVLSADFKMIFERPIADEEE